MSNNRLKHVSIEDTYALCCVTDGWIYGVGIGRAIACNWDNILNYEFGLLTK